ncbi:hypothetical protein C8R46DRAFT_1198211 [Mycena filopes]|nr:hypothetical protein C8R46DRAFT_1198211 [Mycena filopes]
MPTLALELALDILSDDHPDGLAHLVIPRDSKAATPYRTAFEAAMRTINDIPTDIPIWPTTTPISDGLCRELGYTPILVSSPAMKIMRASGAYSIIENRARYRLLESPSIPDAPGLTRLRAAISAWAPDIPAQNITIRKYTVSSPSVAWDKRKNLLAFASPRECADDIGHPGAPCFCWIGPALLDAAGKYSDGSLPGIALFQGYLESMNEAAAADDTRKAMDVDITLVQQGSGTCRARDGYGCAAKAFFVREPQNKLDSDSLFNDAPAAIPEDAVPNESAQRVECIAADAGVLPDDAPSAIREDEVPNEAERVVDNPTGTNVQTDRPTADTPAFTNFLKHYRAQEAELQELKNQSTRLSARLQAETRELQLRTAEVKTLEVNAAADHVVREEMRQRLEASAKKEREVAGLRAEVARLKTECADKDAVIAEFETQARADAEVLRSAASAIDAQLQRNSKRRRTE